MVTASRVKSSKTKVRDRKQLKDIFGDVMRVLSYLVSENTTLKGKLEAFQLMMSSPNTSPNYATVACPNVITESSTNYHFGLNFS